MAKGTPPSLLQSPNTLQEQGYSYTEQRRLRNPPETQFDVPLTPTAQQPARRTYQLNNIKIIGIPASKPIDPDSMDHDGVNGTDDLGTRNGHLPRDDSNHASTPRYYTPIQTVARKGDDSELGADIKTNEEMRMAIAARTGPPRAPLHNLPDQAREMPQIDWLQPLDAADKRVPHDPRAHDREVRDVRDQLDFQGKDGQPAWGGSLGRSASRITTYRRR